MPSSKLLSSKPKSQRIDEGVFVVLDEDQHMMALTAFGNNLLFVSNGQASCFSSKEIAENFIVHSEQTWEKNFPIKRSLHIIKLIHDDRFDVNDHIDQ